MEKINKKASRLLIAMLCMPLLACSEEKPKKPTAMEEARARIAKHKKKYENPKGQAQKNKAGMPDWAPEGFPYPKETIVRFHTGNLHGGMVNLTSNLGIDVINDFYLKQMPASGWKKGSTQKREYSYLFKKMGKEAIITLSTEPGEESKTRIKLTIVM